MRKENIVNTEKLSEVIPQIVKERLGKNCKRIRFIGGGSNGKAFRIDIDSNEPIVIKAFRYSGMNTVEAHELAVLGNATKVKMPEVLFTYDKNNISLMAMTLIKGQNVLNPLFLLKSKKKKAAFAEAVVNGLMDIHSVTGDKYGDIDAPEYSNWLEYYKQFKLEPTLRGLEELVSKKKFSKRKYRLLKDAAIKFLNTVKEPEKAVLIHGDMNIMNIMADTKSFELTGFIDPLGSMYADRDYDLFQLMNMWGNKFGLFETYKKKADITDANIDFKVIFYGTVNEASCRLGNGLIFPLWEDLWFIRLKRIMKKSR